MNPPTGTLQAVFQIADAATGTSAVVRVVGDAGANRCDCRARWDAIGAALAMQPLPKATGHDADIQVQIASTPPPRPVAATRIGKDARGVAWRTSEGWYIERTTHVAALAATAPRATLALTSPFVPRDATTRWAHAFRDVLTLLLPRIGWMPLHAAALQAPESFAGPRALLLAGPSGCGKSTLTTGLLMRGWACVSDDMLVVPPPVSSTVRTCALAATIHVCTDAWDQLGLAAPSDTAPDLFGQFTERPKRALGPHSLPDSKTVGTNPMRRAAQAAPAVLLLPSITDRRRSRLVSCTPTQAVPALLAQGVPPALLPAGTARAQWERMGHLLRQCTAYRLHAGRDLYRDPGLLASLLHEATPTA